MIMVKSNINIMGFSYKKGEVIEQIPPRLRRALSHDILCGLFETNPIKEKVVQEIKERKVKNEYS